MAQPPDAKRAKSSAGSTKEPLLVRNDPLRLLTTAYFDNMHLEGRIQHMPPELQEIMFDYLSPTALQLLAVDPTAVLVGPTGEPTQPWLDALREVFDHYATHSIDGVKTMDPDDFVRYVNRASPIPQAEIDKHFAMYGIPHYSTSAKHIAFGGFVKDSLQLPNEARRNNLKRIVSRIYS